MIKALRYVLLISLFFFIGKESAAQIYNNLYVENICIGDTKQFDIHVPVKRKCLAHSLYFNSLEFEIYHKGTKIKESDSICFNKSNNTIQVNFNRSLTDSLARQIRFVVEGKKGKTKYTYNIFVVSKFLEETEFNTDSSVTISLSKLCSDRLNIGFPQIGNTASISIKKINSGYMLKEWSFFEEPYIIDLTDFSIGEYIVDFTTDWFKGSKLIRIIP